MIHSLKNVGNVQNVCEFYYFFIFQPSSEKNRKNHRRFFTDIVAIFLNIKHINYKQECILEMYPKFHFNRIIFVAVRSIWKKSMNNFGRERRLSIGALIRVRNDDKSSQIEVQAFMKICMVKYIFGDNKISVRWDLRSFPE